MSCECPPLVQIPAITVALANTGLKFSQVENGGLEAVRTNLRSGRNSRYEYNAGLGVEGHVEMYEIPHGICERVFAVQCLEPRVWKLFPYPSGEFDLPRAVLSAPNCSCVSLGFKNKYQTWTHYDHVDLSRIEMYVGQHYARFWIKCCGPMDRSEQCPFRFVFHRGTDVQLQGQENSLHTGTVAITGGKPKVTKHSAYCNSANCVRSTGPFTGHAITRFDGILLEHPIVTLPPRHLEYPQMPQSVNRPEQVLDGHDLVQRMLGGCVSNAVYGSMLPKGGGLTTGGGADMATDFTRDLQAVRRITRDLSMRCHFQMIRMRS